MISRVLHGWTTPADADAYEALLKSEIFICAKRRQIAGYRGFHLSRTRLSTRISPRIQTKTQTYFLAPFYQLEQICCFLDTGFQFERYR